MVNIPKSNIEIINGLSYEEYVEGIMYDKTLQFQFNDLIFTEQRKLLKGTGKFIFYFFMYGYMIGPLILVPLIAYKYENWYLLFGILFSYLSTFLTTINIKNTWGVVLLFFIWYWFKNGFHLDDYLTFFYVCYFWGGIFYQFAVGLEEEYAKIEVVKNSDIFNRLSQSGIIYFMKKNDNLKESSSSEPYILCGRGKFEQEDFEGAILDFTKAIEISPNYSKGYLNRGLAKNEIYDFEGAIFDFNKAIEISPKEAIGYFSRGITNIKKGDNSSARVDLTKAGGLGFANAYDIIKSQLD